MTTTKTTTEQFTSVISKALKGQWDVMIDMMKPSVNSLPTAEEDKDGNLVVTYITKVVSTTSPTITGTYTTTKYV